MVSAAAKCATEAAASCGRGSGHLVDAAARRAQQRVQGGDQRLRPGGASCEPRIARGHQRPGVGEQGSAGVGQGEAGVAAPARIGPPLDEGAGGQAGHERRHALRTDPDGPRQIGLTEPVRRGELREDAELDGAQVEGVERVVEPTGELPSGPDDRPGRDPVDVVVRERRLGGHVPIVAAYGLRIS